ncbi:ICS [Coprinopsis cinerea AmutBmut pab1-1]|nr:ICS [Coprinopsis cinerea AmutBmut pab1-1]
MSSTLVVLETGLLFGVRLGLFWGCRKYLLRTVYANLRSLSDASKDDIELDELPTPSTHASRTHGQPQSAHSVIAQGVFSWTFAESSMMFVLLVFQALNLLGSRTRLLNWYFSLFFVVTMILLFIPACVSLTLSAGRAGGISLRSFCGPRALAYLIPVALFLFALSHIPLPTGLASKNISSSILARLIVLGTVILGVLSGFGAVNNSWQFLPSLSNRQTSVPTEAEIQAAEYTLSNIRSDLYQRRQELNRSSSAETQESWFSRVGASFRGGDDRSQILRGLESLEYQMARNVEELKSRREGAIYSETWRGRLLTIAGRFFAIYCVTRVVSCTYNVLFLPSQRSTSNLHYSDLLSNALAYGISRIPSISIQTDDIASFSRQLSLIFVGIIILTSVRYILRGVSRLLRVSSRNLGASLMLLFLAQIMGIYLLSTVVQMRASFPPPQTDTDNPSAVNLFSTIPKYELFGSLFDWSFLLAALAYGFLRWGAEKVNSVGDSV